MRTPRTDRGSVCKKVGVSIPLDLWTEIDRIAKANLRTRSNMIRVILEASLGKHIPGSDAQGPGYRVVRPAAIKE